MREVRLSECLISLSLSILLLLGSVNAENNPNISTNSTAYVKSIIFRLKTIPQENVSKSIRNYDNKFRTNMFGEIIIITDILKNVLSSDEYNNIIVDTSNSFCLYVKNLENPDNDEFEKNEEILREFKTNYINTILNLLNENSTALITTANVFWDF